MGCRRLMSSDAGFTLLAIRQVSACFCADGTYAHIGACCRRCIFFGGVCKGCRRVVQWVSSTMSLVWVSTLGSVCGGREQFDRNVHATAHHCLYASFGFLFPRNEGGIRALDAGPVRETGENVRLNDPPPPRLNDPRHASEGQHAIKQHATMPRTGWDMWVSRSKWPKPPTSSTPTLTRSPLEPGSSSSRGRRGQGATNPLPVPVPHPLLYPLPTATRSPATQCPPGQKEEAGPEETGHRERDEQGEITGQGRARSPKTVQSAEGGEGKDKRERIIVVVRSPCQENYPADAHPSVHKSVLELANPAWTRSVHLDAPGQRHRQQPVSGTVDPGLVKQDKSFRGSDTTKTHLDPQRVRMSSGERPIGAAKGKRPNTEALCQPPTPPQTAM